MASWDDDDNNNKSSCSKYFLFKSFSTLISIIDEETKASRIPPLTLQILLENAVKHNVISSINPLTINIISDGDFIHVKNILKKKPYVGVSTGFGLKTVYLHTFSNDRYPIDERLDALGEMLDPMKFFRINRSTIVNFEAINSMYAYSKSRVNVELKAPVELSFVSSTERSGAFKDWLSGKL